MTHTLRFCRVSGAVVALLAVAQAQQRPQTKQPTTQGRTWLKRLRICSKSLSGGPMIRWHTTTWACVHSARRPPTGPTTVPDDGLVLSTLALKLEI